MLAFIYVINLHSYQCLKTKFNFAGKLEKRPFRSFKYNRIYSGLVPHGKDKIAGFFEFNFSNHMNFQKNLCALVIQNVH